MGTLKHFRIMDVMANLPATSRAGCACQDKYETITTIKRLLPRSTESVYRLHQVTTPFVDGLYMFNHVYIPPTCWCLLEIWHKLSVTSTRSSWSTNINTLVSGANDPVRGSTGFGLCGCHHHLHISLKSRASMRPVPWERKKLSTYKEHQGTIICKFKSKQI